MAGGDGNHSEYDKVQILGDSTTESLREAMKQAALELELGSE